MSSNMSNIYPEVFAPNDSEEGAILVHHEFPNTRHVYVHIKPNDSVEQPSDSYIQNILKYFEDKHDWVCRESSFEKLAEKHKCELVAVTIFGDKGSCAVQFAPNPSKWMGMKYSLNNENVLKVQGPLQIINHVDKDLVILAIAREVNWREYGDIGSSEWENKLLEKITPLLKHRGENLSTKMFPYDAYCFIIAIRNNKSSTDRLDRSLIRNMT